MLCLVILKKELGLKDFFDDLNPFNIIKKLSNYKRKEILPEFTLIIFDEIQSCERALTSLKYFCEEIPSNPLDIKEKSIENIVFPKLLFKPSWWR